MKTRLDKLNLSYTCNGCKLYSGWSFLEEFRLKPGSNWQMLLLNSFGEMKQWRIQTLLVHSGIQCTENTQGETSPCSQLHDHTMIINKAELWKLSSCVTRRWASQAHYSRAKLTLQFSVTTRRVVTLNCESVCIRAASDSPFCLNAPSWDLTDISGAVQQHPS